MSLDYRLAAALASADVWDDTEIDHRPVPETIATLRECAYTLALQDRDAEQWVVASVARDGLSS